VKNINVSSTQKPQNHTVNVKAVIAEVNRSIKLDINRAEMLLNE